MLNASRMQLQRFNSPRSMGRLRAFHRERLCRGNEGEWAQLKSPSLLDANPERPVYYAYLSSYLVVTDWRWKQSSANRSLQMFPGCSEISKEIDPG